MRTEGSFNAYSNYRNLYQGTNSLKTLLKEAFSSSLGLPGMLSRSLVVFSLFTVQCIQCLNRRTIVHNTGKNHEISTTGLAKC